MGKRKFYKYHGAGNDFILLDARDQKIDLTKEEIALMCHRRFGIGADGLMLLESQEGYDFRMVYYNADGGEVAMCGNGARVITLFAHHLGIGTDHLHFMASDGAHGADIISCGGDGGIISLGLIDVEGVVDGEDYIFMNTGVPHHVIFCDDLTKVDIVAIGRDIRNNSLLYPEGTNVNFVEVIAPGHIKVRTYERGVEDETLACGTGIAASAISYSRRFAKDITKVAVTAMGGELSVEFTPSEKGYNNVILEGPAQRVFKGEFLLGEKY